MATRSKSSPPRRSIRSRHWLRFVVTGKARAGIRRFVRHKERDETIELGRKIYDEIVARLPAPLGADALKRAVKTLKVEDERRADDQDRAPLDLATSS